MFRERWAIAVGGLGVVLALAVVACDGNGEEGPGALTSTPTAEAVAPTPTSVPPAPTATSEAPSGETDPADFREFANLVAGAAAAGNAAFFAERVPGEPYTCTETDVSGEGLGGPEPGLCTETGQQLDLVLIGYWQSEGAYVRPETLVEDIEGFFEQALPDESDGFGAGDVTLYATAVGSRGHPGREIHTAILTAIGPVAGAEPGVLFRTARGIDFEYAEGRWVIRGMLVAFFPEPAFFEDFLTPETGPYSEVERY